jgi:hypothetical protein
MSALTGGTLSAVVIEPFSTVTAWTAHRADGSPSTTFGINAGGPPRVLGLSAPSATLRADAGSDGHYLERAGPATDLTGHTDLLLWIRCDRLADGTADQPLFLQVKLGSAAMAADDPGNSWLRLVPVAQSGVWQPVPMSLGDLPGAVRGAVTTLRLTCLDAGTGWSSGLDAILAVQPEVLADADAALLARLDQRLELDGNPVPAFLVPPSAGAAAPQPPAFRISNYDVQPDRATLPAEGPRTDYTGSGFVIRPPATVYQIDYAVEALAGDRGTAAAMLSFALAELSPTALLLGAGKVMTVDWIDAPSTTAPPVVAPPADHPVVHLRVRGAQPGRGTATRAVPPFNEISVGVDSSAIG